MTKEIMAKEKPGLSTIQTLTKWANKNDHSDAHLGRLMGVSSQTIYNWTIRGMPATKNARAAKVIGVSVDAFIHGVIDVPKDEAYFVRKQIPVIGTAHLEVGGYWMATEKSVLIEGFLSIPSADVDAYCIRIYGDLLRPRVKSGDFIVLSPNHPYQAGDEVIVVTKDGKTMVKEFLYRRDGTAAFLDVNGSGERTTLKESDISKIHFISAIAKDALYRAG
jgi:SOS-response transcriptional repressor LexA